MKKIFSIKNALPIGGLLIAFSTIVSCKKLIELPANPPTQITRQEQFSDSASAMSAVAGVYTYTHGEGIPYSDGFFTTSTALSANEIALSGANNIQAQFYEYMLTSSNGDLSNLWTSPYSAIYQVNDVLDGITGNSKLSASFVKQITGEMEVTRAFYYFNLVNLFGGVPLVTSTVYSTNAQLPRASTTAIYSQILTDLNDAVKKLPVGYPSAGHIRPNLYTALALLAKVHLYQGQWSAAFGAADSVISQGGFSLEPNLNDVFLDGSQEAIWQVPLENGGSGTTEASTFLPYYAGEVPGYIVTDSLLSQFEANDQRKTNWLAFSVVGTQTLYYPFKYKVTNVSSSAPAEDYMLLRLAELYLVRAESAAELNNLAIAVADINTIRTRAGLAPVYPATQADVLAAVRKERRTELFCEWGNRWFDLNRTIKDSNYPSTGNIIKVLNGYNPIKDNVYPIPQSQITLNSHLIQNPGYH